MSHTKRTVNERLSSALLIADENNRRLAVRMAKLEAAVTAICQATGIELEFENPEIEKAAKAILGIDVLTGVSNLPVSALDALAQGAAQVEP